MSIKEACYKLSKEIWKLEIREDIKNIIHSMNFIPKDSTEEQRQYSNYAYVSKHQKAQFMGYLIVDYKKDLLSDNPTFTFDGLQEDTLNIIKKCNYILQYINEKCIEDIVAKHPNLKNVLTIYSLFDYPEYAYDINTLIDVNKLTPLISSFKNSDIIKCILNFNQNELSKIPENVFLNVILELRERIIQSGVNNIPEDFHEIIVNHNPSVQIVLAKIFLIILSTREMINNILNMLYQAFLTDKLSIFDENNIINIDSYNKTLLSSGLIILTQPTKADFHTNVTDLVLCNIPEFNINNDLFFVEGTQFSFSQENGQTKKYFLRMLDDNLNPYFNLQVLD